MAKLSILAGATSVSVNVFIQDSSATTGAGLTGLVYNTSSLTAYYVLPAAASVAITLATLAAANSAYSSGGFKEIDATNCPGLYRLDIPNAALASGRYVTIFLRGATNMAQTVLEVELTAWNNQDAVHGGLSCLPNTAVTTNASLLTSGTGTDQLSVASGRVDIGKLLGTAWLTPGTAGTPDVNVKLWNALTTVALPLVPTTAGRTLDVSAGGEAGLDWANVGSPTTSLALTGTTIATTQKVDIETIKTNPVVNAGTITFPTTATLASTTNITAGTIATVTNLTNLPSIPANWLTAAGIAASALNGKGDWLLASSYVAPTNLTAAQIATGVWTDTTAGDFTTSASIGKSVMNGVSLGTGLTVNAVTGLTASNLDTTVSSRMATYSQPTGFLAATFPSGTVANTTNIAAGTITTVTNLTNAPTSGDLTATMKTSVTTACTASTPTAAAVTGAVGSVTGNVGGNVTGSVGSVVGLTASNLDTTVSSRLATAGYTVPPTAAAITTAVLTTQMSESYPALHAAPTLAQSQFEMRAVLAEKSVSGVTMTVNKVDGTTPAETYTLNSATAPTAITRAS